MASRYYPAVVAPTAIIHGGCAGTWANLSALNFSWNPVQWTFRLSASKTNAGTQTAYVIRTNQEANFDLQVLRWLTPPLAAQTLGGTFQMCFGVQATWEDALGSTDDSKVRFKIHVYLADGETVTPKQTLIDNHVDSVDFPGLSGMVWRSLAVAQAVPAVATADGDVIVVEIGVRIVSSPTPTPEYFPTKTGASVIGFRASGANAAFVDAVAGDTSTSRAPWMEFSQTLTEAPASSPPANDACVDALVIPAALPYTSDFIDASASTDTNRAVWWTWTAPDTGVVFFAAHGSNYQAEIDVFRGSCGALVLITNLTGRISKYTSLSPHRSLGYEALDVVQGTQYFIRLQQVSSANQFNAPTHGGIARLTAFYRQTPQEDDLYLPAGSLVQLRDGALTNLSNDFLSFNPTGVAIDYTRRVMDDLNGGTNATDRILIALHDFELVEILELSTFNLSQSEIDFIGAPWTVPTINIHPAQSYITAAGQLHQAWFGNGYLYVVGVGTLPAVLNTVSNNSDYSALKSLSATDGDNQPGAPFTDTLRYPAIEQTAPWAISVDEAQNTLYYTSGAFYQPLGAPTNEIRRYNLTTDQQLAAFAAVPLTNSIVPGLKGLQAITGDGGVFVCNGNVVERRDSAGAVVRTYTPSIAADSQILADVKISADGTAIWVVDLPTTRLFKFDIETGTELLTVQPYLLAGTLVQMAIYQPNGFVPPTPPPPEGCPEVIDVVVPVPPPPVCPGPLVD